MSEEERRILKLLEQGKITAEEADRLLQALGEEKKGGKTLKVFVYKPGRDSPKTRIEVPLSWAKWVLKLVPEKELKKKGIEPEVLKEAITQDIKGKIIDVETEEEKVEVYIT